MFELVGRVAVVTGGARSIGREISLTLARQGAAVTVLDIDGEAARDTAADIVAAGGRALAAKADVSSRQDVRAAFTQAMDEWGRVDILVNNAAICPRTPFEEITDEQWDRTLAVDLRGPFICSQEAVRIMAAQGWGRIIAISSVAGKMGSMRSGTDYAAAKGGLIALTLSIARCYAQTGITANVIAPGTIHSELNQDWPEEAMRVLEQNTPVGHLGQPGDIASAVAFLASEEAGFITGEVLDVNGGFLMD